MIQSFMCSEPVPLLSIMSIGKLIDSTSQLDLQRNDMIWAENTVNLLQSKINKVQVVGEIEVARKFLLS